MNDRRKRQSAEPVKRLSELDLDGFLGDPARKQQFVTPMFDRIAPRYDRFTRLFSFGMDARWKALLVDIVCEFGLTMPGQVNVADLAAGTGDIAIAITSRVPSARAIQLDASREMSLLARKRMRSSSTEGRMACITGDMIRLPLAAKSVDIVTAGYGVRNTPSFSDAVAEMSRVLRPGGVVATLDFFQPANAAWRELFLRYLGVAGDAVGWLWHRDPVVYGYIEKSIRTFMTAAQYADLLRDHSFEIRRMESFLGGGVCIHVAVRR